jgi:hypothetical protein
LQRNTTIITTASSPPPPKSEPFAVYITSFNHWAGGSISQKAEVEAKKLAPARPPARQTDRQPRRPTKSNQPVLTCITPSAQYLPPPPPPPPTAHHTHTYTHTSYTHTVHIHTHTHSLSLSLLWLRYHSDLILPYSSVSLVFFYTSYHTYTGRAPNRLISLPFNPINSPSHSLTHSLTHSPVPPKPIPYGFITPRSLHHEYAGPYLHILRRRYHTVPHLT